MEAHLGEQVEERGGESVVEDGGWRVSYGHRARVQTLLQAGMNQWDLPVKSLEVV